MVVLLTRKIVIVVIEERMPQQDFVGKRKEHMQPPFKYHIWPSYWVMSTCLDRQTYGVREDAFLCIICSIHKFKPTPPNIPATHLSLGVF
jgi:hypothetical protein